MAASETIRLAALYRYPVKGLSPEPLERAVLETSGYFPGDRLYAIENGPSGFDATAPRHQPKTKYLMLMRDEALARLRTRYDDASATLTVEGAGEPLAARLDTAEGRAALEDLIRRFVPEALRGEPRVLAAPAERYRFTDSATGYVSIINRASVQAVEAYLGVPVDPLRFRGNLLVEGLAPFAELEMVGRVLEAPSGLRLKITKRTVRCAATNVDPDSGVRDLDIPWTLDARLGHRDLGVYAEVIAGGALAVGDFLERVG
ncbi:MOSC domain-containing protein [Methylobacterium sp. NEAU 140]|uniref:MOSC domain-containing protein n=1 Tax=Methylobacterium sp. NEAU 140 TaxID=3064945 RepID=UPI0027347978|nr:MOSC N-terminal beta barrel domain-containing protein [Methylobacterium sp. NEAU 140]MDP4026038.1 MOSC domain-containing protein [Methylobacterium sp. NEAU 140]